MIAAPAATGATGYATASVTPARAGRAATLTVTVHLQLQCGHLRPGRLTLRLPNAMHVPADPRIQLDQVRVHGVAVSSRTISFDIPRAPGMTCMAIAPGTVVVTVERVQNPPAGAYAVSAIVGGRAFSAPLSIRP
jgi:hypothetical protein